MRIETQPEAIPYFYEIFHLKKRLPRRRKKDWISILKKNRKLETNSFVLNDAEGQRIPLEGAHIKVEDLVALIPANAYRAVKVGEQTY